MPVLLLSHPVGEGTPMYGDGQGPQFRKAKQLCQGDTCNSFDVSFPNHCSTHVDAPYHFFEEGARLDQIPADRWVFRRVGLVDVPLRAGEILQPEALRSALGALPRDLELLLVRTGFEEQRGQSAWVHESPGFAATLPEMLRERFPQLRAFGMDTISLTSRKHREEGKMAHREFLGRGILLIEDMRLRGVPMALEQVVVAPLLLEGLDGAPATIFGFCR